MKFSLQILADSCVQYRKHLEARNSQRYINSSVSWTMLCKASGSSGSSTLTFARPAIIELPLQLLLTSFVGLARGSMGALPVATSLEQGSPNLDN